MFAAQPNQWLDLLLPLVQVVLHLARKQFPELRVDAADVSSKRIDNRREYHKRDGCSAHGCALRTASGLCLLRMRRAATGSVARSISPCGKRSFARNARSRRNISP